MHSLVLYSAPLSYPEFLPAISPALNREDQRNELTIVESRPVPKLELLQQIPAKAPENSSVVP